MSSQTPPRVVFVCTENANRSQLAEALAKLHGGREIEAYSAGSAPAKRVHARALALLAERGCPIADRHPKGLADLPDGPFDLVVAMGCGDACPSLPARRREEWNIEDPRDLDEDAYRRVYDEIERRVLALLAELEVREPASPAAR